MLTRRLTHRRGGTLDLLTTFAGCRLDEVSVDPAGVISDHFGRLQSIDPRRPGGEVGAAGTRLRQCAARRCRQSCATTPSSSATGSVGAAVRRRLSRRASQLPSSRASLQTIIRRRPSTSLGRRRTSAISALPGQERRLLTQVTRAVCTAVRAVTPSTMAFSIDNARPRPPHDGCYRAHC